MSEKTEWIEEELPTPTKDSEYITLANGLLSEVSSIAAEPMSPPWVTVNQSVSGVVCMEKHGVKDLEGTPLTMLKAVGTIQGLSPVEILNLSLELDVSKRKAYDGDLISLKLIKEIAPTVQVTLSEVNCPFPVANREFCDVRTWRVEDGGNRVIYGSRSVNAGQVGNTGAIRGKAYNGILLEKLEADGDSDDKTRMVFIGYVDPKGWVPLAIINAFKGKITEKYDLYRKVAEKRKTGGHSRRPRHQRSQSAVSPTFPTSGEIALLTEASTKKSKGHRKHRRTRSSAHDFREEAADIRREETLQINKRGVPKEKADKKSHRRSLSFKFKNISPRREATLSRSSARAERRSARAASPVSMVQESPRQAPYQTQQQESELKLMRTAIERLQLQQEINQWWTTRVLVLVVVFSLAINFLR